MYFTPNGIFDTLYDDMGNRYGINELIVSPATGGSGGGMNTEGGTTDYSCDCGGYFELYYEAGSGMEILSNATHAARRAVLCQVMCDLSAFIVPANPNTKVKIHVRSMSALYGTNTPPISVGSGYYCIEPFLNTLGSIVDNQVWRTINSGTDAYQGFGNPFTSITFPFVGTQTGAMFYSHGFIAFDFDNYNWNTSLVTNATAGEHDLYTITLREMLQTLDLASGIDAQIPTHAHSQIQGRYTRYDKFLKTSPNLSENANIPLINNTGQCGQMYNYSWYDFAPTPQLTPTIGNECTIWFRGNVNQAVHSTSNNSVGKRFGYFEDLCHAPNQEYAYYVNSEGETTGLMKRFPKLEERIALCDIGYTTPAQPYLSSLNVYIDGILSIDHDVFIANSNFVFSGGSKIEVQPTTMLLFQKSHLHGCDTIWKGIDMKNRSRLRFMGSVLQDAEIGVLFTHSCHVTTFESFFFKNRISVYGGDNIPLSACAVSIQKTTFDGAGPFLPPYDGQLALMGNTAFSGISVFNLPLLDLTLGSANTNNINIFRNLNMGIQLAKTNADIKLCQFENIHKDPFYNTWGNIGGGSAIYGLGTGVPYQLNQSGYGVTPTFDNCDIGIFTQKMNADISRNTMQNVFIGTQTRNSAYRTVKIYDNNIQTTGGGIVLENNAWASGIQIENNDITIGNPNLNQWMGFYGIYGTDGIPATSASYGTSWNLFLVNNRIKVGRALAGIYFNGVPLADVYSNRITFDDNTNWSSRRGITLENAHRNKLHCNEVNNPTIAANLGYNPAIASNDPYQSAYYTSMSVKNTFEGNKSYNTYYGFRFMGACNNTDFKANDIYEHENGLYIGYNFGFQGNSYYDNGNHWFGTYNTPRLAANNVGISPTIYSNTPPPLNKVFPLGWIDVVQSPFVVFSTNCGIPTPITPPSDSSEFDNLDYLVARDSVNTPIYPEETQWQMEKELYERIVTDSLDISSDSLMSAFVDSKSVTSIEDFRSISSANHSLIQIVLADSILQDSLESILTNDLTQLRYNDSLLFIGGDSTTIYLQNDSLHTKIVSTTQALENLATSQATAANNARVQILTQNGLIDVTEVYEENERTVNDVYFRTIAAYNYDFTQEQIESLASVAYQCPLSGGAAVYRARGMYQSATGFVFFDDTDLCQQQNISWKKAEIPKKQDIKVYPNPTQNQLNIEFGKEYLGATVVVYNALGQLVKQTNLPKETKGVYTFSVAEMSAGVYYIRIANDYSQKIIVQK